MERVVHKGARPRTDGCLSSFTGSLATPTENDAFVTTSIITSVYGRGFEYMRFKNKENELPQ